MVVMSQPCGNGAQPILPPGDEPSALERALGLLRDYMTAAGADDPEDGATLLQARMDLAAMEGRIRPASAGKRWGDLIGDLQEVGSSQQHIDSDFARSTNATEVIRRAVTMLRELHITHDDACRLSRGFNQTSDLRSGDHRINEWLKTLIEAAQ